MPSWFLGNGSVINECQESEPQLSRKSESTAESSLLNDAEDTQKPVGSADVPTASTNFKFSNQDESVEDKNNASVTESALLHSLSEDYEEVNGVNCKTASHKESKLDDDLVDCTAGLAVLLETENVSVSEEGNKIKFEVITKTTNIPKRNQSVFGKKEKQIRRHSPSFKAPEFLATEEGLVEVTDTCSTYTRQHSDIQQEQSQKQTSVNLVENEMHEKSFHQFIVTGDGLIADVEAELATKPQEPKTRKFIVSTDGMTVTSPVSDEIAPLNVSPKTCDMSEEIPEDQCQEECQIKDLSAETTSNSAELSENNNFNKITADDIGTSENEEKTLSKEKIPAESTTGASTQETR